MFVSMPPQGGNVGLTNLNAPGTELLLNLGSGNASGQVMSAASSCLAPEAR